MYVLNQNLKLQIQKLNQQLKEVKDLNSELDDDDNEEESDAQNINLIKVRLKQQTMRANELEDQLVDAKMNLANLDFENDELTHKLH